MIDGLRELVLKQAEAYRESLGRHAASTSSRKPEWRENALDYGDAMGEEYGTPTTKPRPFSFGEIERLRR